MSKKMIAACVLGLVGGVLAVERNVGSISHVSETASVWILHSTECPQSWYELPQTPSIRTKRGDLVAVNLVDTDSLLGGVQSRLLGVKSDHTVLVAESGGVLYVAPLLSPNEIAGLIDHLDESRHYLPDLREAVQAHPNDLEARWNLYYCAVSADRDDEASTQLDELRKLDPQFDSPFAECYKVSQHFEVIPASDTAAFERSLERLTALAASTKTPVGLRMLSEPLAVLHHRVGDSALAEEWLRVRWSTRSPWEGRSVARRLLRNVVGDDEEHFAEDLIGELRECAGLSDEASTDH